MFETNMLNSIDTYISVNAEKMIAKNKIVNNKTFIFFNAEACVVKSVQYCIDITLNKIY